MDRPTDNRQQTTEEDINLLSGMETDDTLWVKVIGPEGSALIPEYIWERKFNAVGSIVRFGHTSNGFLIVLTFFFLSKRVRTVFDSR
jgi:hypothetical protein